MAFMRKSVYDLIGFFILLNLTPSIATNIDCNGRAFHCVNETHFMICVDLGGGVSSTIDNFVIPCPPTTACRGTNHFECEFGGPSTSAPVVLPLEVTNTVDTTTVETTTQDTTTFLPYTEYYNTLSITTMSEIRQSTTDYAPDVATVTESSYDIHLQDSTNITISTNETNITTESAIEMAYSNSPTTSPNTETLSTTEIETTTTNGAEIQLNPNNTSEATTSPLTVSTISEVLVTEVTPIIIIPNTTSNTSYSETISGSILNETISYNSTIEMIEVPTPETVTDTTPIESSTYNDILDPNHDIEEITSQNFTVNESNRTTQNERVVFNSSIDLESFTQASATSVDFGVTDNISTISETPSTGDRFYLISQNITSVNDSTTTEVISEGLISESTTTTVYETTVYPDISATELYVSTTELNKTSTISSITQIPSIEETTTEAIISTASVRPVPSETIINTTTEINNSILTNYSEISTIDNIVISTPESYPLTDQTTIILVNDITTTTSSTEVFTTETVSANNANNETTITIIDPKISTTESVFETSSNSYAEISRTEPALASNITNETSTIVNSPEISTTESVLGTTVSIEISSTDNYPQSTMESVLFNNMLNETSTNKPEILTISSANAGVIDETSTTTDSLEMPTTESIFSTFIFEEITTTNNFPEISTTESAVLNETLTTTNVVSVPDVGQTDPNFIEMTSTTEIRESSTFTSYSNTPTTESVITTYVSADSMPVIEQTTTEEANILSTVTSYPKIVKNTDIIPSSSDLSTNNQETYATTESYLLTSVSSQTSTISNPRETYFPTLTTDEVSESSVVTSYPDIILAATLPNDFDASTTESIIFNDTLPNNQNQQLLGDQIYLTSENKSLSSSTTSEHILTTSEVTHSSLHTNYQQNTTESSLPVANSDRTLFNSNYSREPINDKNLTAYEDNKLLISNETYPIITESIATTAISDSPTSTRYPDLTLTESSIYISPSDSSSISNMQNQTVIDSSNLIIDTHSNNVSSSTMTPIGETSSTSKIGSKISATETLSAIFETSTDSSPYLDTIEIITTASNTNDLQTITNAAGLNQQILSISETITTEPSIFGSSLVQITDTVRTSNLPSTDTAKNQVTTPISTGSTNDFYFSDLGNNNDQMTTISPAKTLLLTIKNQQETNAPNVMTSQISETTTTSYLDELATDSISTTAAITASKIDQGVSSTDSIQALPSLLLTVGQNNLEKTVDVLTTESSPIDGSPVVSSSLPVHASKEVLLNVNQLPENLSTPNVYESSTTGQKTDVSDKNGTLVLSFEEKLNQGTLTTTLSPLHKGSNNTSFNATSTKVSDIIIFNDTNMELSQVVNKTLTAFITQNNSYINPVINNHAAYVTNSSSFPGKYLSTANQEDAGQIKVFTNNNNNESYSINQSDVNLENETFNLNKVTQLLPISNLPVNINKTGTSIINNVSTTNTIEGLKPKIFTTRPPKSALVATSNIEIGAETVNFTESPIATIASTTTQKQVSSTTPSRFNTIKHVSADTGNASRVQINIVSKTIASTSLKTDSFASAQKMNVDITNVNENNTTYLVNAPTSVLYNNKKRESGSEVTDGFKTVDRTEIIKPEQLTISVKVLTTESVSSQGNLHNNNPEIPESTIKDNNQDPTSAKTESSYESYLKPSTEVPPKAITSKISSRSSVSDSKTELNSGTKITSPGQHISQLNKEETGNINTPSLLVNPSSILVKNEPSVMTENIKNAGKGQVSTNQEKSFISDQKTISSASVQSSASKSHTSSQSTANDEDISSLAIAKDNKENNSNFDCKHKKRGRYADPKDCKRFYICIGRKEPVEGRCPENTVFSEIRKQCTNNLSHCIRNNQFQCIAEGRFSDFLTDNVYYICTKDNLSSFMRFKLRCQNGYHLNKTSVRCDLNTDGGQSASVSDNSKNNSDQSTSSNIREVKNKSKEKVKSFQCKKEGKYPDPSDCRRYFVCTENDKDFRQKRKKCDSDEIFHKDKKKCVDADSYECTL